MRLLNQDVRVDVACYDATAQVLTLTISSEQAWDPLDKAVLAAAIARQSAVMTCADVVMADVLSLHDANGDDRPVLRPPSWSRSRH
jgi:hypothetical protein